MRARFTPPSEAQQLKNTALEIACGRIQFAESSRYSSGSLAAVREAQTDGIKRRVPMHSTIFIILLSLWLVGISTPYTAHGYIHILPVLAVAAVLTSFFSRKRSALD
jgi:hypothetical protein